MLASGEIKKQTEPNYNRLKGHDRTDGSPKSLEELEMEYIELTDNLIYKMTDGFDAINDGKVERVIPDTVVFLDKSARPLAWMVNELWDKLAPEPGSDDIPPKPDFKFINIDRKDWRGQIDPNGTGSLNADNAKSEDIEGLRAVYSKTHDGSFDVENRLDDKNILIVDEVKSTGDTLKIATNLLQRAFPDSKVGGTHWMSGKTSVAGGDANADLPVWYEHNPKNKAATEAGRGIGNHVPRSVVEAEENPDRRQLFLATRFSKPDQKALALREDIKKLADRAGNEVLITPGNSRDIESMVKRAEHLNKDSEHYVDNGENPLKIVKLARKALGSAGIDHQGR